MLPTARYPANVRGFVAWPVNLRGHFFKTEAGVSYCWHALPRIELSVLVIELYVFNFMLLLFCMLLWSHCFTYYPLKVFFVPLWSDGWQVNYAHMWYTKQSHHAIQPQLPPIWETALETIHHNITPDPPNFRATITGLLSTVNWAIFNDLFSSTIIACNEASKSYWGA